jgi:hypothetical protein
VLPEPRLRCPRQKNNATRHHAQVSLPHSTSTDDGTSPVTVVTETSISDPSRKGRDYAGPEAAVCRECASRHATPERSTKLGSLRPSQ